MMRPNWSATTLPQWNPCSKRVEPGNGMKRLIKIFWHRLSRPSNAAAGILLGFGFVGGILFWGAFNTGMELVKSERSISWTSV